MSVILDFIREVQFEVGKVKRDKENEYTKSAYASLEGVLDALNPYFRDHGASLTQYPVQLGSEWQLKTTIKIGDKSETWFFPLLLAKDSKNPMQAIGSAMTYARRYQLKGIFNLVDSDDDASAVAEKDPSKPAPKHQIEKIKRSFASINVAVGDIEQLIGGDISTLTVRDVAELTQIWKDIKYGGAKKQDVFLTNKGD